MFKALCKTRGLTKSASGYVFIRRITILGLSSSISISHTLESSDLDHHSIDVDHPLSGGHLTLLYNRREADNTYVY
jgi:hypothetical protein